MTPADSPSGVPRFEDAVMAVLHQVNRYRMTTFAAAQQLPAFEGQGPRAVKATLKHCVRQGWLGTAWLHPFRQYFFLLDAGAEFLQQPNQTTGPLSNDAKLHAASLLFFCVLGNRERHLLTPDEIRQHINHTGNHGVPKTYYIDTSNEVLFGLARVDIGRKGRWDRVIQSIRQDIDRQFQIEGLRSRIAKKQFEITIVTALPQKAARLTSALSQYPDVQRLPVKVVSCPALLPLLATAPKQKGR